MADILLEIAGKIEKDLQVEKRQIDISVLKQQIKTMPAVVPFARSIKQPNQVSVIAELKQASPSAGVIRQETDIVGRVEGYTKGGARALSILTEKHYFHGSPDILKMAKARTHLPVLRKDFTFDLYQVAQTRVMGADVILLITALLKNKLKDFLQYAQDLGLETLVEVHDERELDQALEIGAPVIGVNNRNLSTLQVDMRTSERLLPRIPKDRTVIVESGIRQPGELKSIYGWGAHSVLMGETLMREPDAEKAVRSFVEAGRH